MANCGNHCQCLSAEKVKVKLLEEEIKTLKQKLILEERAGKNAGVPIVNTASPYCKKVIHGTSLETDNIQRSQPSGLGWLALAGRTSATSGILPAQTNAKSIQVQDFPLRGADDDGAGMNDSEDSDSDHGSPSSFSSGNRETDETETDDELATCPIPNNNGSQLGGVSPTSTEISEDESTDDEIHNSSYSTQSPVLKTSNSKQKDGKVRRTVKALNIRPTPESLSKNDRHHLCHYCDRTFTSSSEKARHERSIHTKPYECCFCGKEFGDASTRTKHHRTHSDEKPYNCRFCAKSFNQAGSKTTHERIHTGEKPFKCKFCGKKYSDYSNLCKHLRRTHKAEHSYFCQICADTFVSSKKLKRHEQRQHKL